MKICKKCQQKFKSKVVINGQIKNLQNRQYCLICLPFGEKRTYLDTHIRGIQPNQEFDKKCKIHGLSKHVVRKSGAIVCRACVVERVTLCRQKRKKYLVEYAGGCCKICGYNKCQQALQFHHLNPKDKKFTIADKGVCRSLKESLSEVDKCILLCANCHFELENGIIQV